MLHALEIICVVLPRFVMGLRPHLVLTSILCRVIALSADESTATDIRGYMAISAHYRGKDWQRACAFVDLPEVQGASASQLFSLLISSVTLALNMTLQQLSEKLVCFGADGAAVMQGGDNGVVTQLNPA